MKFIDYSLNTGYENMQIDENLLNFAISNNQDEHILRLYGWNPACVSLGRNQKDGFINKDLLKANKIDCVRRLTGGRALLHDKELTYSYIAPIKSIPAGENILESYKFISSIWIKIFAKLGIVINIGGLTHNISKNNYCMAISTGADLCYQNKKFIGSAQCRKNGYVLQHGSILLDYDKQFLNKIFQENTDFNKIVSLKEINPKISLEDLISAVKLFVRESSVND